MVSTGDGNDCRVLSESEYQRSEHEMGHWIDGPKGWETYVMDEGNYTMDESGFFYQEVDVEKALPDKYGGSQSIQTVYIEGRDEDGNILYRHGMDADGKRFSFNEEVK